MNNKGFALVLVLPFFSVIFGLFFLMSLSWASLHHEFGLAQTCRSELLAVQEKNKFYLEQLLRLNPVTRSLRLSKRALQLQLASCLAAGNPCALTAAERLRQLESRQKNIDWAQKPYFAGP